MKTHWTTYLKRSRKNYNKWVDQIRTKTYENMSTDLLGMGIVPPTEKEFKKMVKDSKPKAQPRPRARVKPKTQSKINLSIDK